MKASEYVFVVVVLVASVCWFGRSFARLLIAQQLQKTARILTFILSLAIVCLSSVCFYQHILMGSATWLGDIVVGGMFAATIFMIIVTISVALYYRYKLSKARMSKKPMKAGSPVIRSIMLNF
ncbi:MAG: hypothetical protein WCI79_03110 [Candidatus Saccharibacteria bacterium]